MTGIAEINGRAFGEISATTTDTWTQDVAARAQTLGLVSAAVRRLYNHVEMKAVVMMVKTGATSGRIMINHAPCGSEPGEIRGCHAYLSDFIPTGSTFTVLGTDANGNPFRSEYKGRADH